jgi:agmatinase
MTYRFEPAAETFLGLPAATEVHVGSVAIFGAVYGTAYPNAVHDLSGMTAPNAVRRAITEASVHIDHWDFDFDGPLLNDGALDVVDLGDVATRPDDNAGNRVAIEAATRDIRAAGAVPVLIGGDDSAAIPFIFSRLTPISIGATGSAMKRSVTPARCGALPSFRSCVP